MPKWNRRKRLLVIVFLLISLLVSGCSSAPGGKRGRSFESTPLKENEIFLQTDEIDTTVEDQTTDAISLDLSEMSFVERNNLFLELLNHKIDAGEDTTAVDELYVLSMEAMLKDDVAGADQYLLQAIIFLMEDN
jgi:hypothetical protein